MSYSQKFRTSRKRLCRVIFGGRKLHAHQETGGKWDSSDRRKVGFLCLSSSRFCCIENQHPLLVVRRCIVCLIKGGPGSKQSFHHWRQRHDYQFILCVNHRLSVITVHSSTSRSHICKQCSTVLPPFVALWLVSRTLCIQSVPIVMPTSVCMRFHWQTFSKWKSFLSQNLPQGVSKIILHSIRGRRKIHWNVEKWM